jgi:nucleoside phosphorylase
MAARRWVRLLLAPIGASCALSGVLVTATFGGPVASPALSTCTPRLLVLSAMPLEIDPLLAKATLDTGPPTELNHRPFVTGTLGGNPVVMGPTGIGPENALATTSAAFDTFTCAGAPAISGVVFSGTSGGDFIGDVLVPARWTEDGVHFAQTDPTMYSVAYGAGSSARLERTTPTGDPACLCATAGGLTTPVAVTHTPVVEFGGTGLTSDPFGGRTLPCAPAGSDIFGCVPCREHDDDVLGQTTTFATGIVPFADPGFFTGYLRSTTPRGTYVSSDEETAVVAQLAAQHGVPFIGFRAASDGPGNTLGTGGDPLHLPGFPAQFLVYRQLAADNAAAMAFAFLQAWSTQP